MRSKKIAFFASSRFSPAYSATSAGALRSRSQASRW